VKITGFLSAKKLPSKQIGKVVVIVVFLIFLYSTNDFLSKRIEPLYLADFNEKNVPNKSLIITNDRILYLFSKQQNIPIFLQTDDRSRRGWLSSPIDDAHIPQKIYFILRDQVNWIDNQGGAADFSNLINQLPEEIESKNKTLSGHFIANNFKLSMDKHHIIMDDEVNPYFYKKREVRIIILDKK
jgi:hypothetical protein